MRAAPLAWRRAPLQRHTGSHIIASRRGGARVSLRSHTRVAAVLQQAALAPDGKPQCTLLPVKSLTDGTPQGQRVFKSLGGALGEDGGRQVRRVAQQAHTAAAPNLRCKGSSELL